VAVAAEMTARPPPPLEPFVGDATARSAALEKVDVGRHAVARAEDALRATLGEIESAPRADKVAVSVAVRAALQDLHEAKRALSDLEGLVAQGKLPQSSSDDS
jgi:ribosomal protein L5